MPVQMECVKFLVEERGVEINQQDITKGWTPLMRCARMAHYTTSPYLAVFEYLLTKGADASIMTDFGFPDREKVRSSMCIIAMVVFHGAHDYTHRIQCMSHDVWDVV